VIDESQDQRRSIVLNLKMETLEEKGGLLDWLLTAVRELDPSSATQIMNLIRSPASLNEVRMHVDDLLQRGALEKSEQLIEVCNEVQRLHESDEKAQRREDVTENMDYVSRLLSVWLTWLHPYLNSIDQDLSSSKTSGPET
jgi:hypothetical protein